MAENETVKTEDVVSVGSRISWGAILAGVMVSLACYIVLTMLGTAIGFTIGGDTRVEALAGGALVWAILTTGLSLFAGGWVASQLTAGETRCEAMIHGVILWGTVAAAMLWMTAAGVSGGFNSMLRIATAGAVASDRAGGDAARTADWEAMARRAGYTQEEIDAWKRTVNRKLENVDDPETRDNARRGAAMITWGALFGMLLSMGAAIGGALVGAGPTRRLIWAGKPMLHDSPQHREYAGRL